MLCSCYTSHNHTVHYLLQVIFSLLHDFITFCILSLPWVSQIQWQAKSSQVSIGTENFIVLTLGKGRGVKINPTSWTIPAICCIPSLHRYFAASAPWAEHVNAADSRYHLATTAESRCQQQQLALVSSAEYADASLVELCHVPVIAFFFLNSPLVDQCGGIWRTAPF